MSDKLPFVPSQMPLEDVLEAGEELGPNSKLKRVLVLLVTKIDRGFAGLVAFVHHVKGELSALKTENSSLRDRLNVAESQIATLMAQEQDRRNTARAAEASVKIELARMKGADDAAEKAELQRRHQDGHKLEWAKLNNTARVALIGGAVTILGGIIAAVAKWLEH